MGKVVSPYLFGMTNPHERNRYCNNSSAKDEPGVGLSIPEPTKYISGSKRVQHYKFTGILQPAVKTGFRRLAHEGPGVEIKVADLA